MESSPPGSHVRLWVSKAARTAMKRQAETRMSCHARQVEDRSSKTSSFLSRMEACTKLGYLQERSTGSMRETSAGFFCLPLMAALALEQANAFLAS